MAQLLTPDLILGQREIFLIYGDPKTGKTFLALTAPDPIYILCVGPENELKTRYSKAFMKLFPDKYVMYDSVMEEYGEDGSITDNPIGYDRAMNTLGAVKEGVIKGTLPQFATYIIDNATMLEDYQMNKAMLAGYDLAKDQSKTAFKTMREHGIIKPADSDYGSAQSLMYKIMNFFSTLPGHLVLVAHEYKDTVQIKGSREKKLLGIYPQFVGAQRVSMARAFDNVWRMSKRGSGERNTIYTADLTGSDTIVAGTRVGGLFDDTMDVDKDFNLSTVIEKYREYPKDIEDAVNRRAVGESLRTVRSTAADSIQES